MLLRLLPLKVIVNGHDIYEFKEKQPLLIYPSGNSTTIEVINGFHISNKITVASKPATLYYEVECRMDDVQLVTGVFIVLLLFAIYIFTGQKLFMILANFPVAIFLYIFYIRKKDFIKIYPLKP